MSAFLMCERRNVRMCPPVGHDVNGDAGDAAPYMTIYDVFW